MTETAPYGPYIPPPQSSVFSTAFYTQPQQAASAGSKNSEGGGGISGLINKLLSHSLYGGAGGNSGGFSSNPALRSLQQQGIQNYANNVKSGLGGVTIDTWDNNPSALALQDPNRFRVLAAQGYYGSQFSSPKAADDYIQSARDNYLNTGYATSMVPPGVTTFNADHAGGDASAPNVMPSVGSWITPGGIYDNVVQGLSNLTQGNGFHTYPFPAPDVSMPQNSFENLLGSAQPMSDMPGPGADNFVARSQWYANPFNGMGGDQFSVMGQNSSDYTGSAYGLGPNANNNLFDQAYANYGSYGDDYGGGGY